MATTALALAKPVGKGSPTPVKHQQLYALTVVWLVHLIYTITLRLSLADQGGGFDVPKEKCPPDIIPGGSLDEVTARSTSNSPLAASPSWPPHPLMLAQSPMKRSHSAESIPPSLSLSTNPREYPSGILSPRPVQQHEARFSPPLTPPSSTPGSSPGSRCGVVSGGVVAESRKIVRGFEVSPLETPPATPPFGKTRENFVWAGNPGISAGTGHAFLGDVFPEAIPYAVPYARSVNIVQDGVTWEGMVLALPNQSKTLYVCGKGAEKVQLRESIVALLDLADEHLDCSALVIALEKESRALAGLIHSLMYVNGQVVSKPPFRVSDKYVLVGIEI